VAHLNISFLKKLMAEGGNSTARDGSVYVECVPVKPFSVVTVNAMRKQGYPVTTPIGGKWGVYTIHPKPVVAK
jgi:hypothetical protein